MELSLGPPASPLPPRWWFGLSRRRVAKIVHVEMTGAPTVLPTRHYKGYPRVWVGRGHPYAGKSGTMELHRWIKSRELGRRLATYEHVHHEHRAPKDTQDAAKLSVLESVDHAGYHYGTHFVHDSLGRFVWVGCGREMTAEEIQESIDANCPE